MKRLSFLQVFCSAGFLSAGLTALDTPILGVDVQSYLVQKGIQYIQTSSDSPIPDGNNGAIFEARIRCSGSNLETSAAIQLPAGALVALPQDAADEFQLKQKYDKQ